MFYMFEVQTPVDTYPVFGLKRRSFLFVIDRKTPLSRVGFSIAWAEGFST